MTTYSFSQVDVFAPEPLTGNPVAVVHDATGLERGPDGGVRAVDEPVRDHLPAAADRSRGRLPAADLHPAPGAAVRRAPDAGQRPRLARRRGSARATRAGRAGVRRRPGRAPRRRGRQLAFRAPDLLRAGPSTRRTLRGLSTRSGRGPRPAGARQLDRQRARDGSACSSTAPRTSWRLRPDFAAMRGLDCGVIGPHDAEDDPSVLGAGYEVRAFCPGSPCRGPRHREPQRRVRALADPHGRAAAGLRRPGRAPRSAATAGCTSAPTTTGEVWVGGACHTLLGGARPDHADRGASRRCPEPVRGCRHGEPAAPGRARPGHPGDRSRGVPGGARRRRGPVRPCGATTPRPSSRRRWPASLTMATLGDLAAPSLFSTTRCVVVRRLEDLPEESAPGLLDYAAAPAEDVALVLAHSGGQKGSGLLTKLRKLPAVTEVKSAPLTAREFPGFVVNELRAAPGADRPRRGGLPGPGRRARTCARSRRPRASWPTTSRASR